MLLGFYDCQDAVERLDDYLDGELTPGENRHVAIHLAICLKCAQHYRFERGLIEAMRVKLEKIEAPTELTSRIHQSLAAIESAES